MILTAWWARVRAAMRLVTGFVHRRSRDLALDEEMQFHLDQATKRNIQRGLTPDEARHTALAALGGRTQWTEATRDQQRSRVLNDFTRDLRYGAAGLRRNIGFAAGGVITIALAIAATTTVYNFVSAVYLRSLDVPEGRRLVRIHGFYSPQDEQELGFPAFRRLRAQSRTLDVVAAHYSTAPLYLQARGEAREVSSAVISADYFRMLGIRPVLGRFFVPEDDSIPDRDAVAVIGYRLWQNLFRADHTVLGERVIINGRSFTIVGVAPPEFVGVGGDVNEMWIPTMMLHTGYRYCDGFSFSCTITTILARLAPGVTLPEAQAELNALRATLVVGADTSEAVKRIVVEPAAGGRAQEQRQFASLSTLLFAIAIVLLLVACANLAGLLLARGMARRKEFALRSSLGASRWRIVRQLLAESLVLGVVGGVAGIALSVATSRALVEFFSVDVEGYAHRLAMPVDGRVLVFVVCATSATVLLFGLFPALRVSNVDVSEMLKTNGNRASSRARSVLVAAQAVLAVSLLIAAGLLSRSFERAMSGGSFDPTHVAQLRLRPRLVGYSPERAQAYLHAAIEKIRTVLQLPGARSVKLTPLLTNS